MPEKVARWTLQRIPEAPSENLVGRLFAGRYLLERKIGSGGMSTIYEARDANLGKHVVVKILRTDLPSDPVDRFRREAVVLAGLTHEHIGGIIDRQDPDDGPRFLVADYIDGLDLNRLRRRGPMPAAVVLQIGLQVSAALAYAHAAGVIHRDLKPSNIMLVRHPGGDVFAKVIDFGIAKLERGSDLADAAPPGARRETRGDHVAGTAPYWSGHEGARRDVFALALSLAELLTGEDPDPAADLAHRDIPGGLAKVIGAAIHGEATTMDALHAALREADLQTSGEAEAERRRYVARVFPSAQTDEPPPSDHTPRFADRYVLCGELGAGGMGLVQEAFDTVNRRRVALKTIHPRCAGMTNLELRFRREAWALAAIDHRGAPILFESGTKPEPYFTMEIVEGMSLADVLRQGKVEPVRALSLAIDLAGVLHMAHEVGVLHRDVKPSNVVLEAGDRVRLLDFGACLLMPRFYQQHPRFPGTPTGQRYATGELETVGTPGYTAPEILEMHGTASPRSDVYSVCAVLYEMLTGRPYENPRIGRAKPIERGEFPTALGPIADVLRSGTAREPSERPWSMADLVRSLEIVRAAAIAARRQRQLALVAVTAALSAVMLCGLTMWLVISDAGTGEAAVPPTSMNPPAWQGEPSEVAAAPAPPPADELLDDEVQPAMGPEPPSAAPAAPSWSTAGLETTATTPPVLTLAKIRARLATRQRELEKCGAPILVLGLAIAGGRPVLTTVNGMSEGDPLHTCIKGKLRGLEFPSQKKPRNFTVTLTLAKKGT